MVWDVLGLHRLIGADSWGSTTVRARRASIIVKPESRNATLDARSDTAAMIVLDAESMPDVNYFSSVILGFTITQIQQEPRACCQYCSEAFRRKDRKRLPYALARH